VVRGTRHTGHRGGLLLVPAAAVAVHQLRYMLAYGSRAGSELAAQGHSYLHSLVPWTILVLALGAGSFLRRAAHAVSTGDAGHARRLPAGALWLATFAGLLAIYATQETLEGLLATGHPGGVGGVVGHGGWWAIPAAAAIALAVTALLLAGRVLLRVAAQAYRSARRAPAQTRLPAGVVLPIVRPLARAAAGRAPPRLLPAP
jgi:hypothetical protein